jgi:hypothetical protein
VKNDVMNYFERRGDEGTGSTRADELEEESCCASSLTMMRATTWTTWRARSAGRR